MRRSCAPSRRSINPSNMDSVNTNIKNSFVHENEPPIKENKLTNIIFNVVWSKITKKKHKTWEGDGTLEVKENVIILRDINGQELGTSNTFNYKEICEGARMLIGSKEIEIQEQNTIKNIIPSKRKNLDIEDIEDDDNDEKIKKSKVIFSPELQLTTIPKITKKLPLEKKENLLVDSINSCSTFDLLLPTPSYAHRCEHNTNKEPLSEVIVAPSLVKHLHNHQRSGVIFLYECLLGFRNSNYFGAILADETGLGKTLQCITICHTLLNQGPYGNNPYIKRVLIVTPHNLIETWSSEVNKWLSNEKFCAFVIDTKHKAKQYTKNCHMPFVIVAYEHLVNCCDDFESINFDLLICDEGHLLNNYNCNEIFVCLRQLHIKCTILLSGTPIQNNLKEFFNLIDFVNPGILGTYQEYKYQYEIPICNSQRNEADEETKLLGIQRVEELNNITSSFILKRSQSINNEFLSKKREYILFLKPSELQQILLKEVINWYENNQSDEKENLLQIIDLIKKICNHPALLRKITNKNALVKHLEHFLPHWSELGPFDSSKLSIVHVILQEIIPHRKEKIVIVSNYNKTLDMIQGLCDNFEFKYLRLDGQTTTSERKAIVEKLNSEMGDIFIFLLNAKTSEVGLNLSGASRLILYDNDWNYATGTDLQAFSGIWREGQKIDVKIYRLITARTIEENILQRQIAKTMLSGCEMNLTNDISTVKFSIEELNNLFTIQENYESCITHESLNCDCGGNGQIVENITKTNVMDSFRIDLNKLSVETRKTTQINELMNWEHYNPPISEDFLKESSLLNAVENITFIFSRLTDFTQNLLDSNFYS